MTARAAATHCICTGVSSMVFPAEEFAELADGKRLPHEDQALSPAGPIFRSLRLNAVQAYSRLVRWRAIPSSRSSGSIPSSLASVGAISTVLAGCSLRSPLQGPQKMIGTRRS
jgi:hypothetical protein